MTAGRPPKPVALKLLQGNPGKRALNLADGVNPRIEIPKPPSYLGQEGRREWRRITPMLEELGLISGLDRAALGLYCQSVGRLTELEAAFNSKVAALVADGDSYEKAVYKVSHAVTPSGYAQQSVLAQLIRSHRDEVNRYMANFGLSPAARARVTASNYTQPQLPGIEGSPVVNPFQKFAVVQSEAAS